MLKALEYENQVKSDLQVNYEVIEVNCWWHILLL
jgi:hypothetical protein